MSGPPAKSFAEFHRRNPTLSKSWAQNLWYNSRSRTASMPRRAPVARRNPFIAIRGRPTVRAPLRYPRTARRATYARRASNRRAVTTMSRSYATRSGGNPRSSAALTRARVMAATRESPCVAKWALSLSNPFSGPKDACNPFSPPLFSERVRSSVTYVTSTANTASGTGTLIVGAVSFGPTSGQSMLAVSDNTAWNTGTGLATVLSVGTVPVTFYADADFAVDQNAWTPISLGVRIMYFGTADTFGGYVEWYESPNHANIVSATFTSADLSASAYLRRQMIQPGWNNCVWSGPRRAEEMLYNTDVTAAGGKPFTIAFHIHLTANANAKYVIEAVSNHEVSGIKARGATFSEQDTKGGAARQSEASRKAGGQPVTATGPAGVSEDSMFGRTYVAGR